MSNKDGFSNEWEDNVYSQGKQLNLYPFDSVIKLAFRNYGALSFEERKNVKILEIGFGAGNNLWFLAREGFTVYGIEGSKSAVEFTRNRFEEENLKGEFVVGDIQNLPFGDEIFDLVIDRSALNHNSTSVIDKSLVECKRTLCRGGKMFSSMFSDKHSGKKGGKQIDRYSYGDFEEGYFIGLGVVHFANEESVRELFGSKFKIIQLTYIQQDDYLSSEKSTLASWEIVAEKE